MKTLMKYVLVIIVLLPQMLLAQVVVHHHIEAELKPSQNKIMVRDNINFDESLKSQTQIPFMLHKGGSIKHSQPQVKLKKLSALEAVKYFPSLFNNGISMGSVELDYYLLNKPATMGAVTLEYERSINHAIQMLGAESDRSVSDSPGIIDERGVYLSGESFWYPYFGKEFVTFELSVKVPVDWRSVSQGSRIREVTDKDYHLDTWQEQKPQDNIYLIAAKFSEYSQAAGAVTAYAFLREPDSALAQKYLDTTGQYLEMYRKLIGPFPYKKFALVENFWETGFGMPSFTLLGPRIIRFPFILHSSYPHELLHNWWGNSVYVGYQKGNWAEGLTAYLADHLVKEQRGKGAEHRRNTLQKYTNYTQAGNDFPLQDFISRHNAVTEAVGYGKTLMVFHMLRLQLGDELFTGGLQRLYQKYRYKIAAYDDIEKLFSEIAGRDLKPFFEQWITRTGAADIKLANVRVRSGASNRYQIEFELVQIQDGKAYELDVPVAITMQHSKHAFQKTLKFTEKKQLFTIELNEKPVRLDVDPAFDIFRRLDLNETPPAFSQMFGAPEVLIVLPSNASDSFQKAYRQVAQNWAANPESKITIVSDNQLQALPDDKAVWLFGMENKYYSAVEGSLSIYPAKLEKNAIRFDDQTLSYQDSSIAMVGRNSSNNKQPIALLSADMVDAVSGLGRKLPHYGRYSYLAFNGAEPTNYFKGSWPIVGSPLSQVLMAGVVKTAKLDQRPALAELAPVFSEKNMMQDIKMLASAEMQGRGLGTEGLDKAANYIAQEIRAAGLRLLPGYQNYFQEWQQSIPEFQKDIRLKNVVGFIPGTNPKYKNESVIVSAHYDHLGNVGPGIRQADKGKVHFGADDNASGVAVMLELIRLLAGKSQNERSIIFVAFTAEEANRLGSQHFVKNLKHFPLDKIMGVVNLDTVGRLNNNPVHVFGTGSASEWVHIFRGVGFVTGVPIKSIAQEFGSSDQRSFLDVNVPGVQFFSGVNQDFHRPTDTIDKIDSQGLIKIATVLKETVDYLTIREEPLSSTLSKQAKSAKGNKQRSGRKVSLGTVPDFTYEGQGVLVSSVVTESPAEKAGIQAKDIIVGINQQAVDDLRGFAQILRTLKPGDEVTVKLKRGQNIKTTKAVLKAR